MPLYHSVDEDGAISFCNKLADIPGGLASTWDSLSAKIFPFDCPLALVPLCQSGGCMAKFDSAVTG